MAASECKYVLVLLHIHRNGDRWPGHVSVHTSFKDMKTRFITAMEENVIELLKETGEGWWGPEEKKSTKKLATDIGRLKDETFKEFSQLFPEHQYEPLLEVFVKRINN